MRASRTFSKPLLTTLSDAKIIGIRAGRDHRFIGVWLVVIGGRVFVRSWNDKPDGWYRALLAQPLGALTVGDREIKVRGQPVRGERLLSAIDRAYAEKYDTPGSRKYVLGFRRTRRRRTTTELLPR